MNLAIIDGVDSPTIQTDALRDLIPADANYRRPRPSILYRLSMIPVAFLMLLLPVIYVALIIAAAYGVYYHGTHNFNRIMSIGGISLGWRIQLFKIAIYAAPLVAGIVLVFFMVKPIFARRGRRAEPYALNPGAEPRLFAFITGICQMVGAPAPRRIDLNCDINASASFRRGWRSLFGNDLVLTLGLPLIATMTVEEFACVLAHEFGHFSQGLGLRISYVIRSINGWFARVVFERDSWDDMLDDWDQQTEGLTGSLVVFTARLGVGLSRLILHLLMILGHVISSAMDRQQEFNADAYAIHAVGSDIFEKMQRRLSLLETANAQCLIEMRAMWKNERSLPDNFPLLLAAKVEAMPEQLKTHIDDRVGLRKTGLFDTHPCDADRIRQARLLAETGFIRCPEPATVLFENFPMPAKFVTLFHYQALRIPITQEGLRPVLASRREREAARNENAAILTGYFSGLFHLMSPISFSAQELAAPKDEIAVRQEVKCFRPRFAAVSGQIAEVIQQYVAAEQDPETQGQCRRALRGVADEFHRHLASTLSLLQSQSITSILDDAETMKNEVRAVVAFLRPFAAAWPILEQCRSATDTRLLGQVLFKLRDATIGVPDPFDSRKQSRCLFDRFVGGSIDTENADAVAAAAKTVVERFTELYEASAGRLAQIAGQIEAVV